MSRSTPTIGKQWKQPYGPSDLAFRVEGDPRYAIELSFGIGGDTLSAMPACSTRSRRCAKRGRACWDLWTYRGIGVATSLGRDDVEVRVGPVEHRDD